MKRFKNIVFVIEADQCDDKALKQVASLAQSNQASLTVIGFIENISKMNPGLIDLKNLQQDLVKTKREKLIEIMGRLELEFTPEVKIFHGKPFIDVIQEVIKFDRDLLIKTVVPSMGVRQALFGSLDLKLLRKCPCPVWLIKSTEQRGYKEILVALDYQPENQENNELNIQLIDMAVSLSISEFSELHVVHAWELANESLLRSSRTQVSDEEIEKILKIEEKSREQWLSDIVNAGLSKHGATTQKYLAPKIHLIKGQASKVIPELADELTAELVVMGTIGRSGIPGYVIGNTAETVLNGIGCSVLAVKPSGFKSPININNI